MCDIGCASPDPDCAGLAPCGQGHDEGDESWDAGDDGAWSGGADESGDICEALGWYGDGWCDLDCERPDPDC